jgi:hypothetical protein
MTVSVTCPTKLDTCYRIANLPEQMHVHYNVFLQHLNYNVMISNPADILPGLREDCRTWNTPHMSKNVKHSTTSLDENILRA